MTASAPKGKRKKKKRESGGDYTIDGCPPGKKERGDRGKVWEERNPGPGHTICDLDVRKGPGKKKKGGGVKKEEL